MSGASWKASTQHELKSKNARQGRTNKRIAQNSAVIIVPVKERWRSANDMISGNSAVATVDAF